MIQVWFLFNIIETCIGFAGIVYHIRGFTYTAEPLPHVMVFCGTFFGFTLLALTATIAIVIGGAPPVFIECIINFTATIFYIFASILSMYYAEIDFHLMYLSDFEEPLHPYFVFCRSQSICALAAGVIHYLHALLALDALLTRKSGSDLYSDSSTESEEEEFDTETRHPIRMYFLSKYIETKLRRYTWFDNLCRRPTPTLSLFKFMRSKSSAVLQTQFSSESKISKVKSLSQNIMKGAKHKKDKRASASASPPVSPPASATPPAPNSTHTHVKIETESEDEREVHTSVLYNESKTMFHKPTENLVNEKSKAKKSSSMSSDPSVSKRESSQRISTRFVLPNTGDSSAPQSLGSFSKPSKDEPKTSILRTRSQTETPPNEDQTLNVPNETKGDSASSKTELHELSDEKSDNKPIPSPQKPRRHVGTGTLPNKKSDDQSVLENTETDKDEKDEKGDSKKTPPPPPPPSQ